MKNLLETNLVGKQEINEVALKGAIRNEDGIDYAENPLYLSEGCRINKIYVVKDEAGNVEEYLDCRKVKIQFGETNDAIMYSNGEIVYYEIELLTSKTLEELEEAILNCNDDTDVEMLDESSLDYLLSNSYVTYISEDAGEAKPSKEKLNKLAVEYSTRDREEIQYDLARPFVINETLLIESIHMAPIDDDDAITNIVNRAFTDEDNDDDYLKYVPLKDEKEEEIADSDDYLRENYFGRSYEMAVEDEENMYDSMRRELEGSYSTQDMPIGGLHKVIISFKDKPEVIAKNARLLSIARDAAFKEYKDKDLALREYDRNARQILKDNDKYIIIIETTLELNELESILLGCEDEEDIQLLNYEDIVESRLEAQSQY